MENLPIVLDLNKGEKFLVLSAHPDDEIFGAGGTLSFLSKNGKKIDIFIFSKGEEWGSPEIRVKESIQASKYLGLKEPFFFDFPDGNFIKNQEKIEEKIREIISKDFYDGIFCPSFEEFHKDHKTIAFSLIKILQAIRIDDSLQEKIWNTKFYFYEIFQAQKVNSLFDITEFIDLKKEAIKKFESQLEKKDFLSQIIGLNSYRSFTLSKESKFAEGFITFNFQEILKKPITDFIKDPDFYESPQIPISVIIRTKDRQNFLKEALDSVKNSIYKIEKVIIVNDGLGDISLNGFEALPIEVLKTGGKGRAFAANLGIKNSKTDFISFLDDDDLIYPHHFNVLSKTIIETKGSLVYSDSLSSIYEYLEEEGKYVLKDKIISYSMDFDPDILLYDNYIPLNTILFKKELFDLYGHFKENLDIFEDWELLIRFSRKISFYHKKEITCEYRNFSHTHTFGSEPYKKTMFQKNRMEILKLTKEYRTIDVEERVVKNLKDKNLELKKEIEIIKGENWYLKERNLNLEREKEKIKNENELLLNEIENLKEKIKNFEDLLKLKEEETKNKEKEINELSQNLDATYNEIRRLNTILAQIYSSKTWKLHTIIEKIKKILKFK